MPAPSPLSNDACVGLADRLTADQCALAVNIGCNTPGIRDACPYTCACGTDVATTLAPIAPNTLTLASASSVVYKGDFKHGLMTFSLSWNAADIVGPVDMIPVVSSVPPAPLPQLSRCPSPFPWLRRRVSGATLSIVQIGCRWTDIQPSLRTPRCVIWTDRQGVLLTWSRPGRSTRCRDSHPAVRVPSPSGSFP